MTDDEIDAWCARLIGMCKGNQVRQLVEELSFLGVTESDARWMVSDYRANRQRNMGVDPSTGLSRPKGVSRRDWSAYIGRHA